MACILLLPLYISLGNGGGMWRSKTYVEFSGGRREQLYIGFVIHKIKHATDAPGTRSHVVNEISMYWVDEMSVN